MPSNQASAHHERGRILTLIESTLLHPTHADGFVDSGDPVSVGSVVGVALLSAAAANDGITVDTEGIFNLAVIAKNGAGTNDAVVIGDKIYQAADGTLDKGKDGIPFGFAQGAVTAGSTTTIGVKLISHKAGERFNVNIGGFAAADDAKGYFIAPAPCKLIEATEAHGVVAGQAGTLQLEKCTTGEDAGAGDELLAADFDLTSTVNTPVTVAALATGVENFADGDMLRLKEASGSSASLADATLTAVFEWV